MRYLANDTVQGMTSPNESKYISTSLGCLCSHTCQRERACSATLEGSIPRLGSPQAGGLAPVGMWWLGNREPHLIPQQLLMGATKERPLLSVVSASSCCFGTQTHRLLIIMGRILGKHEGLLCIWEEEDTAQGNHEEL